MPLAPQNNLSTQYNYDDFVAELKSRLQSAHQIARERLIDRKEKSKEYWQEHKEKYHEGRWQGPSVWWNRPQREIKEA
jgi:hypothetical protein